jgi:D-alanyl-lipoteichoic acid acyltransferase DltB (MBOAT superfamily)
MVVNSVRFLLFFIVVFTVYYLPVSKKYPRFQNLWLLLSSYFFYGVADWLMVPLLIGATIVFYGLGAWLKSEMRKRHQKNASRLTTLGVCLGIGLLLYFKYLNFFAESFAELLSAIGLKATWTTLNIVLPIGVSFFTFKLISYIIEIHREHIEPCKDFIEFATYIAFFPTLLSGPIDRPNTFIPQLRRSHSLDYVQAVDGCRQILWGMFTKICIADHLALVTDSIWADYSSQSGSTLLIWTLLYTMQIYTDFDGYSNMAIGVGKILGFNITRNFNHPLLARNIAEFWRNWHISLTSWITDYVFMPLNIAFRNLANWGVMLAVVINIVLIGLWHGANWTFGLFGLYHAMLYVPLVLSGSFGKNKKLRPNDHGLPKWTDFWKMLLNYFLVSLGFIIFHADSIADAFRFFGGILSTSLFSMPSLPLKKATLLFILIVLILEWTTRKKEHPLQLPTDGIFRYMAARYLLYAGIGLMLFLFAGEVETFIYFQF